MSDHEEHQKFMDLVEKMRAGQRGYFKTRSKYLLLQTKELEREVDQYINNKKVGDIKEKQPELF